MKYHAILFDVSDTLVRYEPNYAQIYGDRLKKIGIDTSINDRTKISKVVNQTIYHEVQKEQNGAKHLTEKELNEKVDYAVLSQVISKGEKFNRVFENFHKLAIPKQELIVMDGVYEVLNFLKGRYQLGIISNHKTWLMDYLHKCKLDSYFDSIIISDIVGISKPDSAIMHLALKELEIEANQCLYVGDQPLDILCSKGAGLDCVWLTSENKLPESIPYKADYIIRDIRELIELLS